MDNPVLYAFIAGLLAGILVNSIYRTLRIQKIKANFERDLQVIEGRRARMVESDVKEAVKDQEGKKTGT
jgi:hypothetical protein